MKLEFGYFKRNDLYVVLFVYKSKSSKIFMKGFFVIYEENIYLMLICVLIILI